jgi:hydrogenase nickel incorporation protein HypA/HybF
MHKEFSIIKDIFKKCIEIANSNEISYINEIHIEVGDFALFTEIYAQEAFDTFKKGTIAEDALLIIKRTPGILQCKSCDQISEIWLDNEKEKAALNGRLEEYELNSKHDTEESLLRGDLESLRKVFNCRKCNSSDTNLIKGKEVLFKNIGFLPLATM